MNIEDLKARQQIKDLKEVNIPKAELEKLLKGRALTDVETTPFTTYSVEELEKANLITTPKDTPFLNLLRNKTKKSMSWLFEWNEVEVQSNLAQVKYDGNTPPADVAGTPSRKSNYIMPAATVAKVSNFAKSFTSTGGDALEVELEQKFLDINRGVEYFLWNGDKSVTATATETDGLVQLVTTAVDNGTQALQESKLQTAILQVSAAGGNPTHILCSHTVAQRIVNFANNKIAMTNPRTAENGLGMGAMTYLSPFGQPLTVVPVIDAYIPSGKVYVVDIDKMKIRHTENALINFSPLGITTHGDAFIFYSYFGLEVKGNTKYHRVIENVTNEL